jgi:hypothetical protein
MMKKAFAMKQEQPSKKGEANPGNPTSEGWCCKTNPFQRSLARM